MHISTGLVTCTICHDPHADMATTPKLLRTELPAMLSVNSVICPFTQSYAHAKLSHPLVTNYLAAFAADPRFTPATVDATVD